MNKFEKLSFIQHNDEIRINEYFLSVLLHD
jgi:hypothetical protein